MVPFRGRIPVNSEGQQSPMARWLAFSLTPAPRSKMDLSLPSGTPREHTADVPTSVYRYYDEHGLLVYVGITARCTQRNTEHNRGAQWWPYVTRQEVQHFPNRRAAEDQEQSLIRQYRPPFNVQHNPDAGSLREAYLAFASAQKDETPREMLVRLNHLVPMTVHYHEPGLLGLITNPVHSLLTSAIDHDPETRLYGCGLRNRRVDRIEQVGLSRLILIRCSAKHAVGRADARVRMTSQKPQRFIIRSINCLPPSRADGGV